MSKGTAWRIGGFAAALTASVALVAAATGTTGAYFTDTHDGTLNGSSGHLTLQIGHPGQLSMNFTDLIPGQTQTKHVSFTTNSSSDVTEDVWVLFPVTDTTDKTAYAMFTGGKGEYGYADGGLGRYAQIEIGATTGSYNRAFVSHNLANDPSMNDSFGGFASACYNPATGRGGETAAPTSPTDTSMGYCGVPKMILVASNLSSGAAGTVDIKFGLTGKATTQNVPWLSNVHWQIVATQHGVAPNAANY